MNNILYLNLKAKWYDLIESGYKKEEYREIKDYWIKRLDNKVYDKVCFIYGYTKRKMVFNIKSITKGIGNKEWGAPSYPVYIIKLGEKIDMACL